MKTALQVLIPCATLGEASGQLELWFAQEGVLAGRVIGPEYGRGHWICAVYLEEPEDPDVHHPYDVLRVELTPAFWNMLAKPRGKA